MARGFSYPANLVDGLVGLAWGLGLGLGLGLPTERLTWDRGPEVDASSSFSSRPGQLSTRVAFGFDIAPSRLPCRRGYDNR